LEIIESLHTGGRCVKIKNRRETKKIEIGAEAVLYVGNEDEK